MPKPPPFQGESWTPKASAICAQGEGDEERPGKLAEDALAGRQGGAHAHRVHRRPGNVHGAHVRYAPPVRPAPSAGLARTLEFDSPAERAAAELRGWLEAGERVVALLAPRGELRRRVLESLAASLEGRFVAAPWTGDRPSAPRASTLDEVRGKAPRTLLLVEDGERLGAEGARVLRALADDPSAERCVAVALEAEEAGAVLGGLGPELEIVVLREAAGGRGVFRGALRITALGAALGLAGVSLGVALALLLPRFEPPAVAPAAAPAALAEAAAALPPVAAPPPVASGPEQRTAPSPSAPARAPAAPEGRRRSPPSPTPRPLAPSAAPTPTPVAAASAAPAPGWLVVNAIPRAWIAVDGAALGETPIVRHPVSGGTHRVSARFEDGRQDERRVDDRRG